MFNFDLKLSSGEVVKWYGASGEDAARRYAENHPGVIVVEWRAPKYEFLPYMPKISEK